MGVHGLICRVVLSAVVLAPVVVVPTAMAQNTPQAGTGDGSDSASGSTMSAPDKETASRVESALKSDPKSYYRHVTVRAENGVVTLSGFVFTDTAMNKAKEIAGRTPGVTKVVNQMRLEREENRPGADR